MGKISYHTATQVLRALKQEYYLCLKAITLLNQDEISIRLKDIKNDVKILSDIVMEYENGVNRGKTIKKGIS